MIKNTYEKYVLPKLLDTCCSTKPINYQREKVIPNASGAVLEIGIGSGLNIPFLATSIIPLDDIAPKATPKLAIIIKVLKETTFDPIAEFKKFTASLLTPTIKSTIANIPRIMTSIK